MKIIRVTGHPTDPAVVCVHAAHDTAGVLGQLPQARWLADKRVYVLHRRDLPQLHDTAQIAGVHVLDETRPAPPKPTQRPDYESWDPLPNQREVNLAGIAEVRAAIAASRGQRQHADPTRNHDDAWHAARSAAMHVACSWCRAPVGAGCVQPGTDRPLTKLPAHPARQRAAARAEPETRTE